MEEWQNIANAFTDLRENMRRQEIRELFFKCRGIINKMADEERLCFFDAIEDGYCRNCGTNNLPCPCNNDE